MSIQKSSAHTLRKIGHYYTSISNKVAQSIKNPNALAIWTFLQTQSEGFQIRAGHIQKHFSMGETSYQKGMRVLKDMRLIRRVIVKGENGKFIDNEIECHSLPYPIEDKKVVTDNPENRGIGEINTLEENETGSPTTPKNGVSVNTDSRLNEALINYQDSSLINDKEGISEPEQLRALSFEETENPDMSQNLLVKIHNEKLNAICSELAKLGFVKCSPQIPHLASLIDKGVTLEQFLSVAKEVKARGITSFPYVVSTIKGRMDEGKVVVKKPGKKTDEPASASHKLFEDKEKPIERTLTKEEIAEKLATMKKQLGFRK